MTVLDRPPMTEWPGLAALADEVDAALAALGDDVEAVADALTVSGVRGLVGDPEQCPVARWLRGRFPALGPVRVMPDRWRAVSGPWPSGAIPWAVRMFIGRFDAGMYPTLVDEADRRRLGIV